MTHHPLASEGQRRPSGGWREGAHEHLGMGAAGLGCHLQQQLGDVLWDLGLTAVLADLGGHVVDDDSLPVPMERDGGGAVLSPPVMADDALHWDSVAGVTQVGAQRREDSRWRPGASSKIRSFETSGIPSRSAVAAIQRSALCSR